VFSVFTVAVSLLSYYLNPSLSLLAVLASSGAFILFVHFSYRSAKYKKLKRD
jgi:hypothetical protein